MNATDPDRRATADRHREFAAENFAIADRFEDSAHDTVRRLSRIYRRAARKHLRAAAHIETAVILRLRHLDQGCIDAYRRYRKQPSAARWAAYVIAAKREATERHRYETGRADVEPSRISKYAKAEAMPSLASADSQSCAAGRLVTR